MSQDAIQPAAPAGSDMLPVNTDTFEQFARLRECLEQAGFTEANICARRELRSISDFKERPDLAPADALDVLIRLYLEGLAVPADVLHKHVPSELIGLLQGAGLLDATGAADLCSARLSLYPLRGLYLISDQTAAVIGTGGRDTPADVVFPAFASTTREFLDALPTSACQAVLDIGAGTGVAALLAARDYAHHAWATDITERATRVARFNARLNGIENVSVVSGDLYQPVAGQTFDRIVSHPPYMPATDSRIVFRDGGADGEQITRRIIQGLPDHLRPGGRFCCRCLATDRKDRTLEWRLRSMLGEQHEEFDIVLVTNVASPPARFYCNQLADGNMTVSTLEEQLRIFRELEVVNLVLGFVYIERHARPQTPRTIRRRLGSATIAPVPHSVEWLLEWEHKSASAELNARLAESRPVTAAPVKVQMTHRMVEGMLRPALGSASTEWPFVFSLESSPDLGLLLGSCDGTRTVLELHQQMSDAGAIPAETTLEKFLELTRLLVGGAIIETEVHPLPTG